MSKRADFLIYPSLLNKFQSLLNYEQETDMPWNIVSESAHKRGEHLDKDVGDYILSPDEMYDKIENELLDMVNRITSDEPMEAADKGTAFNEVIDCLVEKRPCNIEGMTIESVKDDNGVPFAVRACYNGFTWLFDLNLCKEVARANKNAVTQYLTRANLHTCNGLVGLYGFLDYWVADRVIDLKTTSNYTFGKFEQGWQHYVYPYALTEEGYDVSEFTYQVVVLSKPKSSDTVITGTVSNETYMYNHERATKALTQICERFIEWLNLNTYRITNGKIFNRA